ncbi:MAG: 3'-5' exonuclease [Halobacteriota archaeon]|nr:3'-5' exonuclease [Halobacteriota archaeon]
MNILFYDTETTGFPRTKVGWAHSDQPHLVQLAGLVVDSDSREIINSMCEIVIPDGWDIPEQAIRVHGITPENATSHGMPEDQVIQLFTELMEQAEMRVAHSQLFDERIIRVALHRYAIDMVPYWDHMLFECTGHMSKVAMVSRTMPSLNDAYRFVTQRDIENAHDAHADTNACMEVFFGLR